MSRRRAGLPWAPTSLPQMRQQWCHVLGEGLDQLKQQAAGGDEQAAAAASHAEKDLAGIAESTLYWVARNMTDLATGAASSLPEWSPAAAIPVERGLLCWAKPAGVFDWPVPGGRSRPLRLPVDAMLWGIRDGQVGISCVFRTDRIADQFGGALSRLPLLSHPVGVWDLEEPVAHRLGAGAVSPLSVLGAAWLLMDQPSVAHTRQIGFAAATSDSGPTVRDSSVSIIELRRVNSAMGSGAPDSSSGRRYDKRFWVSGHWRQQACGPGRRLRKPLWIAPHLKGPEDAPLAETTRVYLWRR